jgi:hypothetical protein
VCVCVCVCVCVLHLKMHTRCERVRADYIAIYREQFARRWQDFLSLYVSICQHMPACVSIRQALARFLELIMPVSQIQFYLATHTHNHPPTCTHTLKQTTQTRTPTHAQPPTRTHTPKHTHTHKHPHTHTHNDRPMSSSPMSPICKRGQRLATTGAIALSTALPSWRIAGQSNTAPSKRSGASMHARRAVDPPVRNTPTQTEKQRRRGDEDADAEPRRGTSTKQRHAGRDTQERKSRCSQR